MGSVKAAGTRSPVFQSLQHSTGVELSSDQHLSCPPVGGGPRNIRHRRSVDTPRPTCPPAHGRRRASYPANPGPLTPHLSPPVFETSNVPSRRKDVELLAWCDEHGTVLLTNNAKDFEPLHRERDHAGVLLYYDQNLPETDPEGLARTVAVVFTQYGKSELRNELVDLCEWYGLLHG